MEPSSGRNRSASRTTTRPVLAEVKLAPCPKRHADPETKVYPVSITGLSSVDSEARSLV